jgi:hypothetical protein
VIGSTSAHQEGNQWLAFVDDATTPTKCVFYHTSSSFLFDYDLATGAIGSVTSLGKTSYSIP